MHEEGDVLDPVRGNKRLAPNFVSLLDSFSDKFSPINLSLILNYNKAVDEYGTCAVDGYEVIPENDTNHPNTRTGLRSWPILYSYSSVSEFS